MRQVKVSTASPNFHFWFAVLNKSAGQISALSIRVSRALGRPAASPESKCSKTDILRNPGTSRSYYRSIAALRGGVCASTRRDTSLSLSLSLSLSFFRSRTAHYIRSTCETYHFAHTRAMITLAYVKTACVISGYQCPSRRVTAWTLRSTHFCGCQWGKRARRV